MAWARASLAAVLTLCCAVSLLASAHEVGAAPMKRSFRAFVAFEHSPFPFTGTIPGKEEPFLDVEKDGRKGHTSPRGGVYWLDETYSDRRVLLDIPKSFDPAKPGVIVVYFHGNKSKLERDVVGKHQVPRQVARAGLNSVLVVPQFAVDALDSTAGRFYEPGFFAKFMGETAVQLAKVAGDPKLRATFEAMPIVIVAYSGGYVPAAFAAQVGGVGDRIRGIFLFDALYGELDKFAGWVERRAGTVFFSAHGKSSREPNTQMIARLEASGIDIRKDLPERAFARGSVTFYATSEDLLHGDFLTKSWIDDPVQTVLAKAAPAVKPPPAAPQAKPKPKPPRREPQ
jgi:hypothetical protein